MSAATLTPRAQRFVDAVTAFHINQLETWLAPLDESAKQYCRERVVEFNSSPTAETLEGFGFGKEEAQDTAMACSVAKAKKDAKALLVAGDTKSARRTLMMATMLPNDIDQFIAEYTPKTAEPQPVVENSSLGGAAQGATVSGAGGEAGAVTQTFFESIALPLLARGLKVCPAYPKNKTVHTRLTPDPLNQQSDDPAQIRAWGQQEPNANVIVYAQQRPDGVLFVDKDGAISLVEKYERETGKKFPRTLLVQSSVAANGVPKGHWYFRQTPRTMALDGNIPESKTGGLFSLRVKNYYVASIGSIHPDTGLPYTITDDAPIVPMPDDFLDWLLAQTTSKKSTAGKEEVSVSRNERGLIPHGYIHGWMVTQAGKMREMGMNIPTLEANLLDLVHKNCEPPIDDAKVRQVARSMEKYEPNPGASLPLTPNMRPDAISPEAVAKAKQEQDEKLAKERADYEALIDECQREEERDQNPYPIDAWKGTPYYDFAQTCGKGNYIPQEFFANGMMSTVGAIAGHRITPVFNPTLQARFITLFLTKTGGIGKNTIFEWCEVPFEDTDLIRRHHGLTANGYSRIGCYAGDFGSARGMAEAMVRLPRIFQHYGEFSTLIEKFSITGSGDAFRDMILNLADSQVPNWQMIKGFKVPPDAPKEVSNSILAATTEDRYQEMMAQSNWETFVQRMNIVPSDETRVVFKLVRPDLASFKSTFMSRIHLLETYRLQWDLSPDAERMGEQWFNRVREEIDSEDLESVGRIQVFLFRIISHMALWLAPLPPRIQIDPHSPQSARPDLVWSYTVGPEIMAQAIRIAEHQVKARQANMPVRGTGTPGVIENLIRKWAFKQKSIRWIELRRRSKIARFGSKMCLDALKSIERSRIISIKTNPDDPGDERDWMVLWIGSEGSHKKWRETRGGKRVNPETGKGYRANTQEQS